MDKILPLSLAGVLLTFCLSASGLPQSTTQSSLPDSPGTVSSLAENSIPASPAEFPSSLSTSASNDQTYSPQASSPQATPAPASDDQSATQTKRILGIIPNFRAVSANQKLPPQTAKEKFMTATEDSFDYSAILLPALLAGYSQATNATPEFHQGAAGYGRYFWHSYVDQAVENYAVEAILPIVTREDNRYYTLGRGGFFKRAGYALSRSVITRNDAGHDTFNISEVVGSGMGAGISNLYYPSHERTLSNTGSKWGLNIGIDAGTFVFKEFWPDINNHLFHFKD